MKSVSKGSCLVLLGVLSWSCVPNSRIAYVQQDKGLDVEEYSNMYFIEEEPDNAIRNGDELYIRVTSADEDQTAFNERTNAQIYDPTVISYTVNDDGKIKLPYIKSVKVSGLTLEEASDKIEKELAQFLYYPSVFMKYVNNKVTILGEVNRPGVYVFNYKSINILQAIGYANDISIFGDRKKVLIIREQGEYRTRHEVDLTSDDLLSDPLYMLKTNDIVYVEPMRRKKWAMSEVPYDLILSIVSLSIVVMTFLVTYYY